MDIVVKLFWKQPLSLSEVLPISDIVVNIPFGTMIVDPTLSVPVTSVNGRIGDVVLTAADVGAATEQYVQDQIALSPLSPVTSVNSKVGDVVLTASEVGATTQGYVDTEITTLQNSLQTSINTKANTSYVDTQDGLLQTAINTKSDAASVTQSLSTKADLVGGVIPANQLPSFVDDVLEYNNLASFPVTGEASKIYIAIDTNKTYRWSSTQYVEIGGGGVALGETSSTAYRGDRGKIAYDHALSQGNPHNTSASEILLDVLSLLDSSSVAIGDNLAVIAGKLQAQINNSGGGAVEWVSASLVGTAHANADVSLLEFAKINGMLFCRGFFKVNGNILTANQLFTITNDSYKVIRPALTTLKNYSGSLSVFTSSTTAYGLRFMVTGNSTDAESASLSTQALEPSVNMSSNSEYFSVAQNFCFGRLVTP